MSFNILVISENPSNNGYILKPLIQKMLQECGKPKSNVQMMTTPKTQGYENAKKLIKEEVIEQYRYKDLLLFIADADGKEKNRHDEFKNLEKDAIAKGVTLFCCAAVQEIEAWVLAGHLEKLSGKSWLEIRADISVKENIFEEFLKNYGNMKAAGQGREVLTRETLKNYDSLLKKCPELKELHNRIQIFM